jgi:protein-tyrosine phosphatase
VTTVPSDAPGGTYRVLVVCTGNICRSPAAELLLRAGLGDRAGVVVSSAGLRARVGEPVAEPMATLLRGRAIDPHGFRARQFEPAQVADAELVLTMTAEQRSSVVRRVPSVVQRTFVLREFVDLAELAAPDLPGAAPAARLAGLVGAVPGTRARWTGAADIDIEDPYLRGEDVFVAVEAQITRAVDRLLGTLAPQVAGTSGDVA